LVKAWDFECSASHGLSFEIVCANYLLGPVPGKTRDSTVHTKRSVMHESRVYLTGP